MFLVFYINPFPIILIIFIHCVELMLLGFLIAYIMSLYSLSTSFTETNS